MWPYQEIEKGPELFQLVLDRRAGQEQLVSDAIALQSCAELAVVVLDPVALVQDEIVPVLLGELQRVP
jgi:hypothetical protein